MKTPKTGLAIILLTGFLSVVTLPKGSYAADINKGKATIKECRDKIAVEREGITADERRLQEAKKAGDKAKIEQVKQEMGQDIAKRKAAIRVLYREMDHNSWGASGGGAKTKRK